MGYSREVYQKACAVLAHREQKAEADAAALRARVFREHPEAAEWEDRMKAGAARIVQIVINHGDVDAALQEIQNENLRLQANIRELLSSLGETATDFAPQYTCPKCHDTGRLENGMCDCMRSLLAEFAAKSLSDVSGMKLTSFADMDLSYYSDEVLPELGRSPREHMQSVLEYCRCYGEDFHPGAESLLLFGTTGTGKTHASLAIARTVIEQGYSVIYASAQQIFHRLEKEHFGREDGDSESVLTTCDLLVLDDLGTEMTTSFTTSCLYNIINLRMLAERPTVISTNLTAADWQGRYGQALTSRVLGTFQPLWFVGADIRQAKMARRLQE